MAGFLVVIVSGPHTCSPIDDISISTPHVEHLIAGKILVGLRVSMLAYETDGTMLYAFHSIYE